LAFLKSEQKSLLSDIASQKKLTDAIEDRLKSALDAFAKQFEA
jgi:F-type H+-transporting ATPase subunit alpha